MQNKTAKYDYQFVEATGIQDALYYQPLNLKHLKGDTPSIHKHQCRGHGNSTGDVLLYRHPG